MITPKKIKICGLRDLDSMETETISKSEEKVCQSELIYDDIYLNVGGINWQYREIMLSFKLGEI